MSKSAMLTDDEQEKLEHIINYYYNSSIRNAHAKLDSIKDATQIMALTDSYVKDKSFFISKIREINK